MIDMSTWIVGKAQTTPDQFLSASTRLVDINNKNGKERPFNYANAVAMYRGWMYAAVWMNAKAIATTPLKMYVRKGPGEKLVNNAKKVSPKQKRYLTGAFKRSPSTYAVRKAVEWGGEFEEVTELHPILALLQNPNPWMSGFEFACMRAMFTALTGNLYLHPVVESLRFEGKSLSRIKELWVMPSQYVKIQPGEPNEEDYIRGYWYGVDQTRARLFAPDEVFHMRRPNPGSQYYGLGEVEANWSTLKLSIAQRETDQAKFDNQSRPDLVVTTESANVSMDQIKELQNEWARLFRGTFRQGAPVFLTGKTNVIPLNWAPSEIGDKEIIIEEIAAVTGVPVSLLKANDPNLASAQVGFASWREQTTLPLCRQDEEFLNNYIMPAFGIEDDAFLAYDDPVPENRDELRMDGDVAIKNGNITRNEWRVENGYEPVDDENADTLLVPTGLTPIDKVGEMPAMGSGFSLGGFGGEDKPKPKPADNGEEKQSKHIYAKSHDAGGADDTARDGESERLIREFMLTCSRMFAVQRQACMRIMRGQKALKDNSLLAQLITEIMNTSPEFAKQIQPFMERILLVGGKAGLSEIRLPPTMFEVTNPAVSEFIRNYSIRLAGEVNTFTAMKLSENLAEGLDAGESTSQLANRVSETYTDFEGYRSEMIARTESARAYTEGTREAWRESDVVAGKTWRLAAGGCPICKTIAQQYGADNPIPLDQPFYPLGSVIPLPDGKVYRVDYAAIMGPPGHPSCRCSVAPAMKKVT